MMERMTSKLWVAVVESEERTTKEAKRVTNI